LPQPVLHLPFQPQHILQDPGRDSAAELAPHQAFRHGAVNLFSFDQMGQISPRQIDGQLVIQIPRDAPRVPAQPGRRLLFPHQPDGLPCLPQRPPDPQHGFQELRIHRPAFLHLRLDQRPQPPELGLIALRKLAPLDGLVNPVLLPGLLQRVLKGSAPQVFFLLLRPHAPGDDLRLLQRSPADVLFHLFQHAPLVGFPAALLQFLFVQSFRPSSTARSGPLY